MDNPEKLATWGTQDEDKQSKNTTQSFLHYYFKYDLHLRLLYLIGQMVVLIIYVQSFTKYTNPLPSMMNLFLNWFSKIDELLSAYFSLFCVVRTLYIFTLGISTNLKYVPIFDIN
jgi:hypothetical protein